jgi:hypothetical protein
MTYVTLIHFLALLFILFLFRVVNNLLNKLVMLSRQMDRMRDSRDNWRDIATLRSEKKP